MMMLHIIRDVAAAGRVETGGGGGDRSGGGRRVAVVMVILGARWEFRLKSLVAVGVRGTHDEGAHGRVVVCACNCMAKIKSF